MAESAELTATKRIGRWLEWRFQAHSARTVESYRGTYGYVWVLEQPNSGPHRVAYKGVDPERDVTAPDQRQLFEREIGIWMRVPLHRCVLPVLSLQFAPADGRLDFASHQEPAVPLVGMPCMDGSLKSWISSDDYTTGDRLWALAQTCHGLSWVYSRGIEGHGDLKPDNMLFSDLHRDRAEELRHRVPQWEVRVADFGWADIWLDREGPEYAKKAFRPYLAPERMNGDFVPEASDAFAVGVIAVELLTGQHPAGAETARVRSWKPNKYRKWAEGGQRNLSTVPADLRALVAACLDPDPHSRPTMKEMRRHICRSLQNHRGFEMAHATLEAWHEAASMQADDLRGARWNERQLAKLSPRARRELIDALANEVALLPLPASQQALANWLTAAESLCVALVDRNSKGDVDAAGQVALKILQVVVRNSNADLRRQLHWNARTNRPIPPDLEPLDVLHDFVNAAKGTLNCANRLKEPEVQVLLSGFSKRLSEAHPLEDFIARLQTPSGPLDHGDDH